MPFYRFHLAVNDPPQVVIERLRSIVQEKPGFWKSLGRTWAPREPGSPPFIGSVSESSFGIHRDIRYRNSFLPIIRGRVTPDIVGTKVSVVMFLHPAVTLFMMFWLGMVGYGAITSFSFSALAGWGMFAFGLALTLGGFYPEAIKAKHLIVEAVTTIS